LNRPGITETHYFGDEIYSKEELVAEMGAAMLCGVIGLKTKPSRTAQAIYKLGFQSSAMTKSSSSMRQQQHKRPLISFSADNLMPLMRISLPEDVSN
jgi:hypothetical protein